MHHRLVSSVGAPVVTGKSMTSEIHGDTSEQPHPLETALTHASCAVTTRLITSAKPEGRNSPTTSAIRPRSDPIVSIAA